MASPFDRAEYSDLYKFLTSVGLLLIGASLFLPWLFLRDGLTSAVSQEEYDKMLSISQTLTTRRFDLIAYALVVLPWFSIGVFILGLILFFTGIKRWRGKQSQLDLIDQLEIDERKARVRPIDQSEYHAKAEEEIRKDGEAILAPGETSGDVKANNGDAYVIRSEPPGSQLASELVAVESVLFAKIMEYNSFTHKVQQNVRLGDRYQIDILLAAYDSSKFRDKFVEVKYFTSKVRMDAVVATMQKLSKAREYYQRTTQRSVHAFVIIVYRKDFINGEELDRFRVAMQNAANPWAFGIQVIADTEVEDFDVRGLLT